MYILCQNDVRMMHETHDLNMKCVSFDHCVKQLYIWIFMQEYVFSALFIVYQVRSDQADLRDLN